MKRVPVRALIAAGALALLALFVAACGSSDKAPAGSKELSYTLTDEGCFVGDSLVMKKCALGESGCS